MHGIGASEDAETAARADPAGSLSRFVISLRQRASVSVSVFEFVFVFEGG